MLRQRKDFDPELSLVAEENGEVVGHVLFSPYRVQLLGEVVKAVNLAPLAISPTRQKTGIGGQLIQAGHQLAREKGYAFSLLLGHPTYYPRFGYQTYAYGAANLKLPITATSEELTERAVTSGDLPHLHHLWAVTETEVDFSLDPGTELLDWISPNPAIKSIIYTHNNKEIAGYVRLHSGEPAKPRMLLAKSGAVAQEIANMIMLKHGLTEIDLPLHPASKAGKELGNATVERWEAAMVCPFTSSAGLFETYFRAVQAGKRIAGSPVWPVAFDLE
jgi:predicted N-acetyltransferase YhbS